MQISKAHVSRVEGRDRHEKMPVLTIEYSDFQDVQVIHDRMNAAKYVLGSNTSICTKAKDLLLGSSNLDLFLGELKLQASRVDNLLERARSGSSLVCCLDRELRLSLTTTRCKISSRSADSTR